MDITTALLISNTLQSIVLIALVLERRKLTTELKDIQKELSKLKAGTDYLYD
ncbi:MAG: hypothetical protein KGV43_02890 [Arcobacter sp.]|nr:hypothetical protein [Arcobacter sp.]